MEHIINSENGNPESGILNTNLKNRKEYLSIICSVSIINAIYKYLHPVTNDYIKHYFDEHNQGIIGFIN